MVVKRKKSLYEWEINCRCWYDFWKRLTQNSRLRERKRKKQSWASNPIRVKST